jgi:DNA polymerase I-like protein with 3'-5' exonuclease and polymerase domains
MKEPDDAVALVVDVETTMKCPVGNNKANPFWPENKIVLLGIRRILGGTAVGAYAAPRPETKFASDNRLLIGHNIAFDLFYLLNGGHITKDRLATCTVWDTQLAEYLLSGQQDKFPSLDEVVKKRGVGTLKDTRVSDMFKAGMGADEVPADMLKDYLKADVENTELVFWSQYAEAQENGMLPLILSQMDARMATIEMIWNGLAVDKKFLTDGIDRLNKQYNELTTELGTHMLMQTGIPLSPTSGKDLSLFLFGGDFTYTERECIGKYKNGKDKFKNVEKSRRIPMMFTPLDSWKQSRGYSTDDKVLDHIANFTTDPALVQFCWKLQELRDVSKQLSTYYEGIDKLIMPDGLVHHDLNHCVTVTGRLSSSNPNLQNVTDGAKGDIKKAFVSRFGDAGVVCEADYSQLEMVMLAVLSGDTQLIEDIRTGTDMHKALFKALYGREMKPEERKKFKRCSFALVYGAGAKGISEQSGLSVDDARKFIRVFYDRYPGVKQWHDAVYEAVKAGREYKGRKDPDTSLPMGDSVYVSPFSQRRFVFHEYPNSPEVQKWKGTVSSFSPTETKNYPVQGGATGDIVPLVLGKLYRVLRNNPRLKDKCLMINTVHDSVMFDIHKDVLDEALVVIKQTMESAPQLIKETFDFTFPLKLNVGVSCGPTWFDQTEIDFSYYDKEAA